MDFTCTVSVRRSARPIHACYENCITILRIQTLLLFMKNKKGLFMGSERYRRHMCHHCTSSTRWELRRSLLRLIKKEGKEQFYLDVTPHKNIIQCFDSLQAQARNSLPSTTNVNVAKDQCVSSLNSLAILLEHGTEGVPGYAPKSVKLYTGQLKKVISKPCIV